MKIFLTGATGYLGSAIAANLVRAKHDVTALVRSSTGRARVLSYGIEPLLGDLREPDSYLQAVRSSEALIHAAVESGTDRLDVDRHFIDTVTQALASPGDEATTHVVYTSTLFSLGDCEDGDESTPAHGQRAGHEQIVLLAGGAVIRPGMILDEESWLTQEPLYIGSGENRWPVVRREDCAELFRMVVERRARGIFHAVGAVIRSRDLSPDARQLSIDEARQEMGSFADALALDQNVSARRSRQLGWRPTEQR